MFKINENTTTIPCINLFATRMAMRKVKRCSLRIWFGPGVFYAKSLLDIPGWSLTSQYGLEFFQNLSQDYRDQFHWRKRPCQWADSMASHPHWAPNSILNPPGIFQDGSPIISPDGGGTCHQVADCDPHGVFKARAIQRCLPLSASFGGLPFKN